MLTQMTRLAPKPEFGDASASLLVRFARRVVLRALGSIQFGCIEVRDGGKLTVFGVDEGKERKAIIYVHNPRFYINVLFGGTVGAGEAYAQGYWSSKNLTLVVRIMAANYRALDGLDGSRLRWLKQCVEKVTHRMRLNTRLGARKNIAAHYDLSNDFFRLWLDDRMMYSSAVFSGQDWGLDQASEHKLERLCEMLDLQPGDRLLDIGGGWGGFAIYTASRFDVSVTTTTISKAQKEEAEKCVKAAGLEGRVKVLLRDYRDLTGQYEKIVSVEMVEAVGDEFLDEYFRKVESLMVPSGRFVMQAITIQDQRYEAALKEVDFIKKHIFPGSFIPSVTRLVKAATQTDYLRLTMLSDIGLDYARTIECWSQKFSANADKLTDLGFDSEFQRLWQFYFSYCEGGFLERAISDVQIAFDNQLDSLQLVAAKKC